MVVALRRAVLLAVLGVALGACTIPGASLPFSEPQAAVVDGQPISMKAFTARLAVSQQRDPFNGIPEAIPSPVPTQRLEDFTIEQLVREEIIRQEAGRRGITVSDATVQSRIDALRKRAGAKPFDAALSRNGFTRESFTAFQRALLTEVGLLRAMAKDRINMAARELKAGGTFATVAARWSDDTGTFARGGNAGRLRPSEIPEATLAAAVGSLPVGGISGIVLTNRGYTIATVLEQRNDQVDVGFILVLAPTADLYSADLAPAWFKTFIDDREEALRRSGKIEFKVGSRAGR